MKRKWLFFGKKRPAAKKAPPCKRVLLSVHTQLGNINTRISGLHTHIGGLQTGLNGTHTHIGGVHTQLDALHTQLDEVNEGLRKMALRQQEAALQLDDIADVLQDDDAAVRPLLDALMTMSLQIENFYRFAALDKDSPLFEQARMMWNAAKTAGEAAAFERIDDARVPFDVKRHETESSERDESLPGGYVLRTLKCGYTYKDEVIRRAAVVVNKPGVRV